MKKEVKEILGYVPCFDCGHLAPVSRQKNGRFYFYCRLEGGCGSHHRFNNEKRDMAYLLSFKGFTKNLPTSTTTTTTTTTDEKPQTEPEESKPTEKGPTEKGGGFFDDFFK